MAFPCLHGGIFIGNEYLRRYHSRLVFSALLFFFSLYSYTILLVPVVIARIGTIPFLMSGVIAVVLFFSYLQILARLGHDRYHGARAQIAAGILAITALINAFYFMKILPPLPLALSDAGVYHAAKRVGYDFQVTAEDEPAAGARSSERFRSSISSRATSSIFTAPSSRPTA